MTESCHCQATSSVRFTLQRAEAVHNANQNLQYAQNLTSNSILENNEHALVSKCDTNVKDQDLGIALKNKHQVMRIYNYGTIQFHPIVTYYYRMIWTLNKRYWPWHTIIV